MAPPIVTPNVKEKIKLYHDAGLMVYPGGTLFEAYFVRNQLDDFLRFVDDLGLETVEVSDGSMVIEEDAKCEMIHRLAKKYRVSAKSAPKKRASSSAPTSGRR